MARKPQTSPRKQASQQRSQLTVDALLEATARVLVRDGYDTASTNKIAEAAGVSIGSLYQYFPGKEALVAAVISRHMREMLDLARATLLQASTLPIETAVRELVLVMIEAHRVNPKLHRVLSEQVPRAGQMENMEALDREAYALVRNYLEIHSDKLSVANLDMAAFICVKVIETLSHTAVISEPDTIAGERMEIFVNEASRLISGYLLTKAA